MTSLTGSDKFKYDTEDGILCTVIKIQSAGASEMMKNMDFYLLLGFHFVFVSMYHLGIIPDSATSEGSLWHFSWNHMRIINTISLFQLVFNSVQVFQRYVKLHNLTMHMLRNVVKLTWQCRMFIGRAVPQYVALSGRYHLAAATLFLESLKYGKEAHESQAVLFHGLSTHLLSDEEKDYLKEFDTQHRSLLLTQWCAEVVKEGFETALLTGELSSLKRESNMKACLMKFDLALSLQHQIMSLRELPTPFQMYHMMNMMVLVNITMWAYFMGVSHAWSSSVAFVGASLIFMNMERVAKRLQDPFGERYRLDFPVQEWCTDCWHAVLTAMKSGWSPPFKKPGDKQAPASPTPMTQSVWESFMGSSGSQDEEDSAFTSNEEWKDRVEKEQVPGVQAWDRGRPLKNDGFGLGTAKEKNYLPLLVTSSSDLESGPRGAIMHEPATRKDSENYSEQDVQARLQLIP